MRTFLDIVKQSLSTLWAHKLRSFLTMFGIAWGVGSLLLLIGLGEGFRSGQDKQLANLGQDIMFAFPRSEEHTSELQSRGHLVCRLLLEKKNTKKERTRHDKTNAPQLKCTAEPIKRFR